MHLVDRRKNRSQRLFPGVHGDGVLLEGVDIPFEELDVTLCFQSPGKTMAWNGPALRGVVAAELKGMTCQWPEKLRASRWRYCKGCEYIHSCGYGALFESEPVAGAAKPPRYSDGMRAITISPHFPGSSVARVGEIFPLRILLLGDDAMRAKEQLLRAIGRAGQARGLGPDQARFELREWKEKQKGFIRATDFPLQVTDLGEKVDGICVNLVSPLFMRDSRYSGNAKRNVLEPSFEVLLRAGIRSVSRSFQMFAGQSLEDHIDFQKLVESCCEVKTRHRNLRRFQQPRASRRTHQRYMTTGVWGEIIFDSVPETLIPWIIWGGYLGCGQHRVAGAGRWTVEYP